MKKIYLVRHGETTYNKESLVQDGSSLLTPLGKKQADVVSKRIQNLSFDHLVVSDYERTKQTAKPIEKVTGINAIYSPLFREVRRPSEFFHMPRSTPGFQMYLRDEEEQFGIDEHWRHSDEENFSDVTERTLAAFEYLLSLKGDIVVVSHGHFIRRLTAVVATNFELNGLIWQKMYHSLRAVNTGITTFTYDEETAHWQLLTFNDMAHFAE